MYHMEALLELPVIKSTIDHSPEKGRGYTIEQQTESPSLMQHFLLEEFDTKNQVKIENLQQELTQLQEEVQQKDPRDAQPANLSPRREAERHIGICWLDRQVIFSSTSD